MASNGSDESQRRDEWLFVASEPEGTIVAKKDSVSYRKRDDIESNVQDGNDSEPEFEILSSFQCLPAPDDDFSLPFPVEQPKSNAEEKDDYNVIEAGDSHSHADDDILIISDYFAERKGGFGNNCAERDIDTCEDDSSDTSSMIGLCVLFRLSEHEEACNSDLVTDHSDSMSDGKSQDFEVVDECDGVDSEPIEVMESSISTSVISHCSDISVHHLFEDSCLESNASNSIHSGCLSFCDSEIEVGDKSFDSSDTSSFDFVGESDVEEIDEDSIDANDDKNFIFKIDLFDADDDVESMKQQKQMENRLYLLPEDDQATANGFIHVDIPTFLILLCLTTALGFSIGHDSCRRKASDVSTASCKFLSGINAYLNERSVRLNGGKSSLGRREHRMGLNTADKAGDFDNPLGDQFTFWKLQQDIIEGEELIDKQRDHLDLYSFRKRMQNDHYRLLQSYHDVKHRLHVTKLMSWYWRVKYENQKNIKKGKNSLEECLVKKLQRLEASYSREKRLADHWRVIAEQRTNMSKHLTKKSLLEKSARYWRAVQTRISKKKSPPGYIGSRNKSKLTEAAQGYCSAHVNGFKNRWSIERTREKKSYSMENGHLIPEVTRKVSVTSNLKTIPLKHECPYKKGGHFSHTKPSKCPKKDDRTMLKGEPINIGQSFGTTVGSPFTYVERTVDFEENYKQIIPPKHIEICKYCKKSYTSGPKQSKLTISKDVEKNYQNNFLSRFVISKTKTPERSNEDGNTVKTYEKLFVVGRNGRVDQILLLSPLSQLESINDIRFYSNGSLAEISWSSNSSGFLSVLNFEPFSRKYEEIKRIAKDKKRRKTYKDRNITVIACQNGTIIRQAKSPRKEIRASNGFAFKRKGETSVKKNGFEPYLSLFNAPSSRLAKGKRKKTGKQRREFLVNKIRTLLIRRRETKEYAQQLKLRFKQEQSKIETKTKKLKVKKMQVRKEFKLLKRQKREFKKAKKRHKKKLERKLKKLEYKLKKEQNRLEKWKEKEEKQLKRTLRRDWEKLKLKQKKTETKRMKEVEHIKKDLTRKKKILGEREKKLENLKRKLETNYRKWAKKLWDKIKQQQLEFERWKVLEKEQETAKIKEQKQKELEKVLSAQLLYERWKGKEKQLERKRKGQIKGNEKSSKDRKKKRVKKYDEDTGRERKRRYWKELERLQQWLLQVEEQKLEQEQEVIRKCPRKFPLVINKSKRSSRSKDRRTLRNQFQNSPVQRRNDERKAETGLVETRLVEKGVALFDGNFTFGATAPGQPEESRKSVEETGTEYIQRDVSGTEPHNNAHVVVEIDEVNDNSGPVPPTWFFKQCAFSQFCNKGDKQKSSNWAELPSPRAGQRKTGNWYLQRALERETARIEWNRGPIPPRQPRADWYYRRSREREKLHQKLIFGLRKGEFLRTAPDWYYLRARGRKKRHDKALRYDMAEEPDPDLWYLRRVKGRARDRLNKDDTWILEQGSKGQNARDGINGEDNQSLNWFLNVVKGRFR